MEFGFDRCNVCEGPMNRVCATCWDQICEGCDHDDGHSVLQMDMCCHTVPSVKRDDLLRHISPSYIENHWFNGELVVHLDPVPWIQDLDDARRLGRPRCNACPNSLKVYNDADGDMTANRFCSIQCKGDEIAQFLNERPEECCTHRREAKKGNEFKFCIDCQGYFCISCPLVDHRDNHRVLRTWGGNSLYVEDVQSIVDCDDIEKKKCFNEVSVQLFRKERHECRVCSNEITLGNEFCSVRCKREDNQA